MPSRSKIVVLSGAILLVAVLGVLAYKRFRNPPPSAQTAPQNFTNPPQPAREEVALPPSRRKFSGAMAVAFDTGVLPDPLAVPSGSIDEQAAALAKRVAAVDQDSTAALLTALQLSGFDVAAKDGSVAHSGNSPLRGIRFEAWEVAAMAKLYGRGSECDLAELGDSIGDSFSGWLAIPVADQILEGLRANATGGKASSRFWARFIVELGRQSPQPYDMLATATKPSDVRLDAVQFTLIATSLAAELASEESSTGVPQQSGSVVGGTDPFLFATANMAGMATWLNAGGGEPSLPCFDSLFFKITGKVRDKMFEGLIESLKKEWNIDVTFSRLKESKYIPAANALLAIAKFLLTYAALNVEIKIDAEPLVRTTAIDYSDDPNNTRTLTAHLESNTGNWGALNCLAPVVKALTGLKTDIVPKNGPIAGAAVEWKLAGGGQDPHAAAQGQTQQESQIVEFDFQQDPNKLPPQCAGQQAKASLVDQFTNKDGNDCIRVVGMPQLQDLSGAVLRPVTKSFTVYVNIALKHDATPIATLLSVGPSAATASKGDLAGPAADLTTELLYRSRWFASDPRDFAVKDWEIDKTGWFGTITREEHTFVSPPTITVNENGRHAITSSVSRKDMLTVVTLSGGGSTDANGGGGLVRVRGTVQGSYSEDLRDANDTTDCGRGGCSFSSGRRYVSKIFTPSGSSIVDVGIHLPVDYSRLFGQNLGASQPSTHYLVEVLGSRGGSLAVMSRGSADVYPIGKPPTHTPTFYIGSESMSLGGGISVEGELEKGDYNHLKGHKETRSGADQITILDWDLHRVDKGESKQ